jgi:hypothetical protein
MGKEQEVEQWCASERRAACGQGWSSSPRSVSADPSFLFMLQYIIVYVALIFLEPLH